MDLFTFELSTIFSFLLTMMRASLVIFLLPIFGVEGLPAQWKAAFVLTFTFAIWPHIALEGYHMPAHPFNLFLLLLSELLLGMALGLAVNFFFAGIQSGGELIATNMGFSMLSFADPMTGTQTGVIAHLLNVLCIMLFYSLDGHLYMLNAFVATYKYLPAGEIVITATIAHQILFLSGTIFVFAIKIIAPVLASLFLTEIGLALMGKATPQMNIMEMGFPLKILIGFFFLSLIFEVLQTEMYAYVRDLDDLFLNLIRSLSPLYQD